MRELFVTKDFAQSSLDTIGEANIIIKEYRAQGFRLTLRQLYYQFVARDLVPNTQRSYKRLGSIISDARLAGMVDWDAIEDRTRNRADNAHWNSPADIISSAAHGYAIDKWATQDCVIECWIEKEALVGVIERVCMRLDIAWFACRGYVSQSEQWAAGKRFERHMRAGKATVVLHLGDHDPSGIDMTRDNAERLSMFARDNVIVKRLALNMDQVEEFNPPPNPAKITDSRYAQYAGRYGEESWELDALDPRVLQGLVSDAADEFRDQELWDRLQEREETEKAHLRTVESRWAEVVEYLDNNPEGDE